LRVDTTPEIDKEFWNEYRQSAGVYTIGEVFNGSVDYVSSYQGSALDATLNYPMYFSIKDVYGYKKSMYELRSTLNEEASKF